jgi:hypothetical protein
VRVCLVEPLGWSLRPIRDPFGAGNERDGLHSNCQRTTEFLSYLDSKIFRVLQSARHHNAAGKAPDVVIHERGYSKAELWFAIWRRDRLCLLEYDTAVPFRALISKHCISNFVPSS